jgi:ubiquinone biosynthesis protein
MRLSPVRVLRLIQINWIMVRYGLDDLLLATPPFRPIAFLRFLLPGYWLGKRTHQPRGVRLRLALEALGPIFVKFGQALSTRRDLLPDDIARELARLQDKVPPFPGVQARQIIEQAYGHALETVLRDFDEQPLASASIAQVHTARLLTGESVIIKVVRPGIERVIRRDVELLHILAELAERYWREGRRLRPREVVREYEKTIIDELDLVREAANASHLKRNFQNSKVLYIPEVNWSLTRRNVLVMERVYGMPIGDIEALSARGVNLKILSERGVEIFFTQVFRDSFFHADMHPGNIFVDASDPQQPRYIAIDFGIIGTLGPTDQHYLAENFLAFFNRDYRRVAELHIESGWVPADTRVDEFESAIRTVSEPIFDKPLKDISFGGFLLTLFQTARRFNMEIQPQLVLLQKTLLSIEGLGRQLDPDLDLWKTAKPYLENWMKQRIGLNAFASKMRYNLPRLLEQLPELPHLIQDTLHKANHGELKVRLQADEIELLRREIKAGNRRYFYALLGTGLLLIAAIVLATDGHSITLIGGVPVLSWISGVLGGLLLVWAWPRSG